MLWRIVRHEQTPQYTLGILFIEDGTNGECYTLENTAKIIPAGEYIVELTTSKRAHEGKLWTPDRGKRLPEILDVPGRTGIRIHAANRYTELDGCVAVGMDHPNLGVLAQSRVALIPLVQSLQILGMVELKIEEAFK